MTDENSSPALGESMERSEELKFCLRIHGAGRFVQNDNLRISQECSCQCHLLPLASAQFLATLEARTQSGLIAPPQPCDHRVSARLTCCDLDPFAIRWCVDVSQPDVLLGRKIIPGIVLENNADLAPQG